jgi:hypothetical protein
MSPTICVRRQDFGQLVDEHRQLIHLTNELELQLYRLGDGAAPEQINECRQIAGNLIALLRTNLFRHDQEVLPVLESLIGGRVTGLRNDEAALPRSLHD